MANRKFGGDFKLVAFDLDGTVLHHGGEISPATLRAMDRASERGITIAVATGRPMLLIPPEIRALPFLGYIISASGALVFDVAAQQEIFNVQLSRAQALEILRLGREKNAGFHVHYDDANYYDIRSLLMMWASMRKKMDRRERRAFRRQRRTAAFTLAANAARIVAKKPGPIVKMTCVYKSHATCEQELPKFRSIAGIEPVTTMGNDIEITAAAATKGRALALLCREMGIKKEQVLAFGDSGNDLSMRDSAGVFVAMGNASAELKAAADYVTGSVLDDGVANALEMILQRGETT